MKVQRLLFIVAMSVALFSCGSGSNNNNGDWVTRSAFGGPNRGSAVAFSIGNVGYVGTGFNGLYYYNDFWAFDPTQNQWTEVDTLPGQARAFAVGFATAKYGYCGTGYNGINVFPGTGTNWANDFYKFDPTASTQWSQITNIPIPNNAGRSQATAFGLATGIGGVLGGTDGQYNYKDFYQWDETTGVWTYGSYPGPKRVAAVSFVYQNRAYIVTGTGDNSLTLNDFWRYDPTATPQWVSGAAYQLRPIGGITDQSYDAGYHIVRSNAVAFTMNNNGIPKAYVALGANGAALADCWEYDFGSDTWTQKQNFPGGARQLAIGLTINDSGYLGLGTSGSSPTPMSSFDDFTQFYPNLPYNQDDYTNE